MIKYQKPRLYHDDKGYPKGYRVGISDNIYGICPFCGKSYSENDIKNPDVINFEHIYPKFATKNATGEKDTVTNIESKFKVAVHKECNSKGGSDLERKICAIINNINSGAYLLPDEAIVLINYCIKTSIFLRYLYLWEYESGRPCYENEKIKTLDKKNLLEGLNFYKDFQICIRKVVDACSGIYWDLNTDNSMSKYCFSIVLNNIEISFFSKELEFRYDLSSDIIHIETFCNLLSWARSDKWGILNFRPFNRKGILCDLEKWGSAARIYKNNIDTLSEAWDTRFDLPKDYFIRQNTLAERFDKAKIKPSDCGIMFFKNGHFYLVDDNKKIRNVASLTDKTDIPSVCFKNTKIVRLEDMSKLNINGNLDILNCCLESLDGVPKYVQGRVDLRENNLKTLHGCPEYIGKSFYCDSNSLMSLQGVPDKIMGTFSCANNALPSLIGAPKEVMEDFICIQNQLTSLEGSPRTVGGYCFCSGNKLKSFKGAPEKIGLSFSFDVAHLELLDGLPQAKSYIVADCGKVFNNADELHEWFAEYKKQRSEKKNVELSAGTRALDALVTSKSKKKTISKDDREH
ncbi:MAG: hypothetical protein IKB49_01525 [Alphaproteobacteria bacterium]|nr:hypothetical protein [Alphaproteobacteria bacterium]